MNPLSVAACELSHSLQEERNECALGKVLEEISDGITGGNLWRCLYIGDKKGKRGWREWSKRCWNKVLWMVERWN